MSEPIFETMSEPDDPFADYRFLLNSIGLWRICPGKRCRRARACRGDVLQCLRDRWHGVMPDEIKGLAQQTALLMDDGVPVHEAIWQTQEQIDAIERYVARLKTRGRPRVAIAAA